MSGLVISGRRTGWRSLVGQLFVAGMIAAAPAAAAADDMSPVMGRWDAGSTDCSYPQGDGVFEVERRKIRFFESMCELDRVRAAGVGNGVIARMTCEGEGERWSDDLFLAATQENTLIVFYGSGYGFVAGRCGR